MSSPAPSLRKRLRNARWLRRGLAVFISGWTDLSVRTTRWEREGTEALEEAVKAGPVIVVTWHSRLAFCGYCWPMPAPISTLNEGTAVGRMMAEVMERQGFLPMVMPPKASTLAQMRVVLKRLRDERISIGIAADGPAGPARELKPVPIDWARIAGVPVWAMAVSQRPSWRLKSWDRTLFPRPFARGAMVVAPWEAPPLPRQPGEAERAAATASLTALLNKVTDRADAMLGLPPQP
ncbi:lysophospholipid acyltransferase family protein [Pseudoroseicyclus sp. CXY001]|uniref:lysophospholipid acyltransferase family protein n=1 Tax=Pseudoroseicyclus sp. CXY001 TaxID=3242492 RepID=UPI0035710435